MPENRSTAQTYLGETLFEELIEFSALRKYHGIIVEGYKKVHNEAAYRIRKRKKELKIQRNKREKSWKSRF